jgi:hypothetical protein
MKYAFLLYEDEQLYGGPDKANPATQDLVARHMSFQRDLGPARVASGGLKSTAVATTLQSRNGKQTIHDGPFAEAREQLGGFYVIEAPDLDAAIAIAKRVPMLKDGAVEIRPLLGL